MDSNGDSTSEAEMLDHVTKILNHMTNKRTQHLFLMKGSQRSVLKGHKGHTMMQCLFIDIWSA